MTHKGTAVITGAVTAIGAAFAYQLAQRGYDLILVAADRPQLLTLATAVTDSSGRSVELLDADLALVVDLARVERQLLLDSSITLLVNHHDAPTGAGAGVLVSLGVSAPLRLSLAVVEGFLSRGAGAVINLIPVTENGHGHSAVIEAASSAFVLSLSNGLLHGASRAGVRIHAFEYQVTQQSRRSDALAIVSAALADFDFSAAGDLEDLPSSLLLH